MHIPWITCSPYTCTTNATICSCWGDSPVCVWVLSESRKNLASQKSPRIFWMAYISPRVNKLSRSMKRDDYNQITKKVSDKVFPGMLTVWVCVQERGRKRDPSPKCFEWQVGDWGTGGEVQVFELGTELTEAITCAAWERKRQEAYMYNNITL